MKTTVDTGFDKHAQKLEASIEERAKSVQQQINKQPTGVVSASDLDEVKTKIQNLGSEVTDALKKMGADASRMKPAEMQKNVQELQALRRKISTAFKSIRTRMKRSTFRKML